VELMIVVLIIGILIVTGLYLLMSAIYSYVLPIDEMAISKLVAACLISDPEIIHFFQTIENQAADLVSMTLFIGTVKQINGQQSLSLFLKNNS